MEKCAQENLFDFNPRIKIKNELKTIHSLLKNSKIEQIFNFGRTIK